MARNYDLSHEDFKHLMEMLRNELSHWKEVFEDTDDYEAEREIAFWERETKRFARYE